MSAQAILRLLISEYGVALRLPAGDNQIAAHIALETGLAQGTLLGILNGSTARINSPSSIMIKYVIEIHQKLYNIDYAPLHSARSTVAHARCDCMWPLA